MFKIKKSLRLTHKNRKEKVITKNKNKLETLNNGEIKLQSYRPTINKQLVTLKTGKKKTIKIKKCMSGNPFLLKDNTVLEFDINGTCYKFYEQPAIDFLLYNLSTNKHVDVNKLITPKQYDANCWFNVLFVIYFISDKGRTFFHYLRQLMIVGTQANGTPLSAELWRTFSLLNYFIELSGKGDAEAKKINTNAIIIRLYNIINATIKIPKKSEAGNPLMYYDRIIMYLNNKDIDILTVMCSPNWNQTLTSYMSMFLKKTEGRMPHIIILEFSYLVSKEVTRDRSDMLRINGVLYRLDSASIIDIQREHFSCCLTLEKKDYMYDGMSNHRLHRRDWKNLLNSNVEWSFKGSTNYDGTLKKWCFLDGYHTLHYYRV
jgi:hypothetical protein